jgi:predicted nucleotidyltransferase
VLKAGTFRPDSDIDIGVEGANVALCFDIWRDLEQAIPEWPLDVRSLDPADAFSERVRAKGELIYE